MAEHRVPPRRNIPPPDQGEEPSSSDSTSAPDNGAPASNAEEEQATSPERARTTRMLTAVKVTLGTVLAGVLIEVLTGAIGDAGAMIGARFFGGSPLSVAVRDIDKGCGEWIAPHQEGPLNVPRRADYRIFSQWIAAHQVIDARTTVVELIVRGNSAKAVVLNDIRIEVTQRREPTVGTSVTFPCAGAINVRSYTVDLDERRPQATLPSFTGAQQRPAPFPYRVSQGEPEVIRIIAGTESCDCSWLAELVWTEGDEVHTTVIDDHGRPFRTTGTSGATRHIVVGPPVSGS